MREPPLEIIPLPKAQLLTVPAIIADAGDAAARRFLEFFTANIRNPNTQAAYSSDLEPWKTGMRPRSAAQRLVSRCPLASEAHRSQERPSRTGRGAVYPPCCRSPDTKPAASPQAMR